ncbi:MAG TPA: amidase family protein [Steroidobacteraceae bacterium]
MTDPCYLTAAELVAAFRERRLSPVEAAESVLARIQQANLAVQAFFHVDGAGVRSAADASAKRWARGAPIGPLDGVLFSVKDHVLTAGMPSPWGVGGAEPAPPGDVDAPIVARLREAGAILLGKTTQAELAMFASGVNGRYGIARNPWDLTRTPGGSSSGAAAALAAGMGPIAIGSDGGGSIRIPASYTGVVGHKPSFGRVPFFPPFGPGPVYGPLTRSVEDIALVMNVVTRPDWRDIWSLPAQQHDYLTDLGRDVRGLRIAYSESFGYGTPVADDVRIAVRAAVNVLKELGVTFEEIPPFFDHDLYDALADAIFPGLRMMAAAIVGEHTERLMPVVQQVLARAHGASLEKFLAAKAHEAQASLHIASVLKDFDLLVTPTMPTTAYAADRPFPEGVTLNAYGYTFEFNPFTWPFNVTLQPAISVPCGLTPGGLPVGLQIVGPRGADDACIRVAHAYERGRGAGPPWPELG